MIYVRKTILPIVLAVLIVLFTHQAYADYSYTAPSNFTLVPQKPEIRALEAVTIIKNPFTFVIQEDTTPWDAYISSGYVPKTHPIRLCRYWQISNVYEFKLRSHFNNAVITPQKDTLMSFKYSSDLLKVFPFIYFPEQTLKIIETDDSGITWHMLKNSTVDIENKTVSAITTLNKGYAIVAGFVNPKILCNYDGAVLGLSTVEYSENSILNTFVPIQNAYELLLDILRYRSEKAML